MKEFFRYQDTFQNKELYHNINFFEWIIPIILVYSFIALIYVNKNTIIESVHLDMIIRVIFGSLLVVFYSSHYILLWIYNGFNIHNLPLHLCPIVMVVAFILLITNNRKLHSFVLLAGVLGGFIALTMPFVGYSYKYYRYYQFMGSHMILIVIPIYYMVVYQYKPDFKIALKVLCILEIFYITITIFNTIFDTNYFYTTLSKDSVTDMKMVNSFGGMPWYVVNGNILGIGVFFLWYFIIQLLFNKNIKSQDGYALVNSVYDKNN